MRLCALVLSDDDRVLKVLEALSPDVIYLAYRGRGLLRHGERLRRLGEVRICTYIPIQVPPGFGSAGPLSFLERCAGLPVIVL
ncbi:hypothetical protein [Thermoproteus tenax]|uniref:Uncharacterized protein n=1 Tax=Thermoproteus tenax (strain ATCC 35583 / DSM 2078 / JCM 9277 / NBRC 100435 / Kra 1) TaxID=768679 RepID=G4RNF9_THETK|nr:hypothetical protein [Thermoproteus tenax]CCC81103.1 hypothetical protein TTX_0434 [Thermoproteus tenax Kra 1]